MCYGFRISSPFHRDIKTRPILNLNYLKNAKKACVDEQFSPNFSPDNWKHIWQNLFSSTQLNRNINWAQNCIVFFQSGLYWTEQLYRLLKPPNFPSLSFKTQCSQLQREGAGEKFGENRTSTHAFFAFLIQNGHFLNVLMKQAQNSD